MALDQQRQPQQSQQSQQSGSSPNKNQMQFLIGTIKALSPTAEFDCTHDQAVNVILPALENALRQQA